jgi:hypothetical protein
VISLRQCTDYKLVEKGATAWLRKRQFGKGLLCHFAVFNADRLLFAQYGTATPLTDR